MWLFQFWLTKPRLTQQIFRQICWKAFTMCNYRVDIVDKWHRLYDLYGASCNFSIHVYRAWACWADTRALFRCAQIAFRCNECIRNLHPKSQSEQQNRLYRSNSTKRMQKRGMIKLIMCALYILWYVLYFISLGWHTFTILNYIVVAQVC